MWFTNIYSCNTFPLYGIDFLDWTISVWAGPILAANYVQPRPFFDLDLNFHYSDFQTTVNKRMNACMELQCLQYRALMSKKWQLTPIVAYPYQDGGNSVQCLLWVVYPRGPQLRRILYEINILSKISRFLWRFWDF